MTESTKTHTEGNLVCPSPESIRRVGTKNIIISVFVAVTSYYSLTLIAENFGGSLGSDAYFFLVSLSSVASGIFGSLMGTVFLPAFIKLLTHSDKSEAHHFASSIFSWCLLISCVIALTAIILGEQFFMFASRFDAYQISKMHEILKYFAPIFLLSVLSEFFRIVVLSFGKFSTTALTAIFPPIFLIAFLILFGNTMQEEALVASLLLAKIVALTMLVIIASREGLRVRFNLSRNLHTFRFLKSSAPYWSANIITNVANFYFDYLASGLGTGVVTALAYANRMFMLPITVFLTPLVEIARTKFAQFQAAEKYKTFNDFYGKLINFAIYFSILIGAIYIIFSYEIISVMFQRGAFQTESVKISASCLAVYAWSIPFVSIFQINGRACESFQRLLWPSVFGTLGNLLMIAAASIFIYTFGHMGIPMAKVVTDVFYFFPFGFIALHLFGSRPHYGQFARSVVESLIALIPPYIVFNMYLDSGFGGVTYSFYGLIFLLSGFFILYVCALFMVSARVRGELKELLSLLRITWWGNRPQG